MEFYFLAKVRIYSDHPNYLLTKCSTMSLVVIYLDNQNKCSDHILDNF